MLTGRRARARGVVERPALLVGAVAGLVVPWWVGTTWLAYHAWGALTGFFGGPGYALLAVLTVASCVVIVRDEHRARSRLADPAYRHPTRPVGPQSSEGSSLALGRPVPAPTPRGVPPRRRGGDHPKAGDAA